MLYRHKTEDKCPGALEKCTGTYAIALGKVVTIAFFSESCEKLSLFQVKRLTIKGQNRI